MVLSGLVQRTSAADDCSAEGSILQCTTAVFRVNLCCVAAAR